MNIQRISKFPLTCCPRCALFLHGTEHRSDRGNQRCATARGLTGLRYEPATHNWREDHGPSIVEGTTVRFAQSDNRASGFLFEP